MIYEMRFMKTPFYHVDEREILPRVLEGKVKHLDEVSKELRKVLIGLLQVNPTERFGLEQLVSDQFYSSSPYSLDEIEQGISQCPFGRIVSFFIFTQINSIFLHFFF